MSASLASVISSGVRSVLRGPDPRRRRAAFDRRESVRGQREPRSRLPVRPSNAKLGSVGAAQSEVDPAELAAGVAAADRHLPLDRPVVGPDLDPGPDRVTIGAGLLEPDGDPVAHRRGLRGVSRPDVPVQADVLAAVHLDDVEHAVEVEVDDGGSAAARERDDAGGFAALAERPVSVAQQQVARILRREVRHRLDVALGDEEVDHAVVVHILELGMPGRGRQHVPARVRSRCGHAGLQRDVAVVRLGGTVGERLELVVALARQEHLRKAVAGDVVAGDAHAPDPHLLPSLFVGVQTRSFAVGDAPQLFLAVEVVVPVVRHPQVAAPGPVPVAEQDRQGAPPGRERDRLGIRGAVVLRPHHLVVRAGRVLLATAHIQVVAERERGEFRRALPLRAERRRPRVAAVVAPCLVRTLEPAVPQAAQEHVLAVPQDGEIDQPVTVDVHGVRADDAREIGGGIRHLGEPQRPSDRALVAIQGGGVGASRRSRDPAGRRRRNRTRPRPRRRRT